MLAYDMGPWGGLGLEARSGSDADSCKAAFFLKDHMPASGLVAETALKHAEKNASQEQQARVVGMNFPCRAAGGEDTSGTRLRRR